MTQTELSLPLFEALPPIPATRSPGAARVPSGFDRAGFGIGWDYARHRLTPPADHLHALHPVRQGWEAGRAAFAARTRQPTRHVRRWLQLRLLAWLDGAPFDELMLSPRYLAQLEPLQCPVTREALTHGESAASDAVVMRLDTRCGYAAGNLAIVSRRALQARGLADAGYARAIALRLRGQSLPAAGGLDATEWERLAALLSFVTRQSHEQLASLPLRLLPPNRLRLLNPVQALQVVLTQLFLGVAYARRMAALGSLMPDADSRRCYYLWMNAMLARRLAAGWSADHRQVRLALEDAWTHPVIERRWERLGLRLRAGDCERIVRVAVQRGLAGRGWRWLDDDVATEGWAPPGASCAPAVGHIGRNGEVGGEPAAQTRCREPLAPRARMTREPRAKPSAPRW